MEESELLEYIVEYFEYSEEKKGLVYKKPTSTRLKSKIGQRIGSIHPKKGYVYVKIKGKYQAEHRLVWLLFFGTFPPDELDHFNLDNIDNRLENLRLSDRGQNCSNRRKTSKPKTSKYKGVYWKKSRSRWLAQIKVKLRTIHLGSFTNETDAAKAYDKAALEHHKEFSNLNFPEEISNED